MYFSLQDFSRKLEKKGLLVHVYEEVSSVLEITEIHRRLIAEGGPAVIFHRVMQHSPVGDGGGGEKYILPMGSVVNSMRPSSMPVICNLFGTVERIALALGYNSVDGLRELGNKLSQLRNPSPPSCWGDIKKKLPMLADVMNMRSKYKRGGPCQEICYFGDKVDLYALPIQTCWPNEPAPLITWGMVITRRVGDAVEIDTDGIRDASSYNIGIYRLQLLSHNRLIVRWLKHRGGADHYREWQERRMQDRERKEGREEEVGRNEGDKREVGGHAKDENLGNLNSNRPKTIWSKKGTMPIAVVVGCEPSMLLSAVMPLPENMSEYNFAGLLAQKRPNLTECLTVPMIVPSSSEIVLEGYIDLDDLEEEGPYGDHTGFYNEKELFPVMTVTAITTRKKPIYLTTYTGKPVDEPAILGMALNEVFIPLIQKQFPEIVDFWLPPEACSYRIAVVSICKAYPGHAKRIMMGIWSFLRQFTYTKMVIVVDAGISVRNWREVMWAVSTHMDFRRDVITVDNTPIDYLDFASSKYELGAKMGFDATTKIGSETDRKWGDPIVMDEKIIQMVDKKWSKYGF